METLPLRIPSNQQGVTVRVSDIRQWAYCPRVIWWTHMCPVGKHESFKMKMGLLKERRLQRLQRRRTLRSFGLSRGTIDCNVNLYSTALGVSGRLDMLIVTGPRRYPVEIKFTHGPARLNHRLQLAGYALLLEELYGVPVPHGYVIRLPDDTVDKVLIDAPLRELAIRTIRAIRVTLADEQIPAPNPVMARCTDCEYRCFCADIE